MSSSRMRLAILIAGLVTLTLGGCPQPNDAGVDIESLRGDPGPAGARGATGAPGPIGEQGLPGDDGINCWDLNGNHVEDANEDINGDGLFDALDCIGDDGAPGENGADGDSVFAKNGDDISYTQGNVGIGTSTPTATLDVEGDARIASNLEVLNGAIIDLALTVNGLLQSVAAGPGLAVDLPGLRLFETGSVPNVVGGSSDNVVNTSSVGAVIAGGGQSDDTDPNSANRVSGNFAAIGGGANNAINADHSVIAGGLDNQIGGDGNFGVIGGGSGNLIDEETNFATIAGGLDNRTGFNVNFTSIGGGRDNETLSDAATVGGGESNRATGEAATVGGGKFNQTAADFATIAGGGPTDANNETSANRVFDNYGTIGGGGGNRAGTDDDDTNEQRYATVSGGQNNDATNRHATIGGGLGNEATGSQSTIAGGQSNEATSVLATIGGGFANDATGIASVIAGGQINEADGFESFIGGGQNNVASAQRAIVVGGNQNEATGSFSMIVGGLQCDATASFSFASGHRARAVHSGAFVWADNNAADVSSFGNDTFSVRAEGGTRFYSSADLSSGVELPAGGGAWQSLSDRDSKENIEAVDPQAVLDALAAIEISTWNYHTQDATIRHMGPMAQDFYAAFNIGEDERHITTIDADGVALAAIQGLNLKLAEKDARITEQDARIRDLESRLAKIEAMMSR